MSWDLRGVEGGRMGVDEARRRNLGTRIPDASGRLGDTSTAYAFPQDVS